MQQKFLRFIMFLQRTLLWISVVGFLILVPVALAFELLPEGTKSVLYMVSLVAVTLVMSIRPLANLFPRVRPLAQLIILRKSVGVLSASIIVGFMFAKIIMEGWSYFERFGMSAYWSLENYALLAHLGDLTAIILLLTSNDFSRRIFKRNWKRIQKLAYVYFYSGALFEWFALGDKLALAAIIVVSILVFAAFVKNWQIKRHKTISKVATPHHELNHSHIDIHSNHRQ